MRIPRAFVLLLLFVPLASLPAAATPTVVDLDWFSNGTGSGVIDPPGSQGPERLRLQGGFTSGFHQGRVDLPFADTWLVEADIANDSQFDLPSEFVEIRIDGVLVATFFNTPLGQRQPFQHTVVGNGFDYRFDFSSPSTDEGSHLIVQRGTATTVPEPGRIAALGLWALAAAARLRQRTGR